jgi:hypothetical protein
MPYKMKPTPNTPIITGILSLAKKFRKENYSCKVQRTSDGIVLTLKSKGSMAFG